MTTNTRVKGYLFSFLSTLTISNVYIFSKAALTEVHIVQFAFYWFLFALVWNVAYLMITKNYREVSSYSRKSKRMLVWIGLIEFFSTFFFYYAIYLMVNPSLVSFLGNLGPILITIAGVLLLKERFRKLEVVGILVTIIGAVILSYKKNALEGDVLVKGVEFALLSVLFYAIKTIAAKSIAHEVHPQIISINRVFYLIGYATVGMVLFDLPWQVPEKAVFNMLIGSFLGPFLTSLFFYGALKHLEAARHSVIHSTQSIWVLLGAYVYFGVLPETYQIAGGVITIVGVILISMKDTWTAIRD